MLVRSNPRNLEVQAVAFRLTGVLISGGCFLLYNSPSNILKVAGDEKQSTGEVYYLRLARNRLLCVATLAFLSSWLEVS